MAYASNNPQGKAKNKKKDGTLDVNQSKYTHQFVRFTPVKADADAVKKFDFSGVDWFSWIDELLDGGYKLSVNTDRKNDCVVASLTCSNEKDQNNGFILTARGTDTTTALAWLYWLHNIRFESGWNESADTNWFLG